MLLRLYGGSGWPLHLDLLDVLCDTAYGFTTGGGVLKSC